MNNKRSHGHTTHAHAYTHTTFITRCIYVILFYITDERDIYAVKNDFRPVFFFPAFRTLYLHTYHINCVYAAVDRREKETELHLIYSPPAPSLSEQPGEGERGCSSRFDVKKKKKTRRQQTQCSRGAPFIILHNIIIKVYIL